MSENQCNASLSPSGENFTPSPTAQNGDAGRLGELVTSGARLPNGRFGPGNSAARGSNNVNRQAQRFRSKLFSTVSEQDIEDVVRKLIDRARAGERWAIRELLDRVLGKPIAPIELSQADAERTIESMSDEELMRIARGEEL